MPGSETRPNASTGVGSSELEVDHWPTSMKQSDTPPSAAYRTLSDYYLVALGVLLAGYAIVGKAFAYIGVPPVYVGEIVFALGIIAFLNSKCAVAAFATLPSLLLGVLFGWAIIRTLPYLGEFGVDALRDSVLVVYGGFAFIIVALLLERPERILLLIRFLRVVARIVIVVAPCLLVLTRLIETEIPELHCESPANGRPSRWCGALDTSRLHASQRWLAHSSSCRNSLGCHADQRRHVSHHHSSHICVCCYRQVAHACFSFRRNSRSSRSRLHDGSVSLVVPGRARNQRETACRKFF